MLTSSLRALFESSSLGRDPTLFYNPLPYPARISFEGGHANILRNSTERLSQRLPFSPVSPLID